MRKKLLLVTLCLLLLCNIQYALALENESSEGKAGEADGFKNAVTLSIEDIKSDSIASDESVVNAKDVSVDSVTYPEYTAMPIDSKWLDEEGKRYNTQPTTHIRPKSGANMTLASTRRHFDLLKYLPINDLGERNQGRCGNCWVWASAACLEISLAKKKHITPERMSIQYLNSNYNNGRNCWACCGGWPGMFADFYSKQHLVIPWSNTNAQYADGDRCCWAGRCGHGTRYSCDSSRSETATPASSISTTTNYRTDPVIVEDVPTKTDYDSVPPKRMTKEQAIANIKDVLDQERAVVFGYFWGEDKDDRFRDFWKNGNEETLWDERAPSSDPNWGHALTCVGYDDTDPNPRNHYWIILNSWGTTANRPHGIFHMPMNLDYDSRCYWWYTFDVKWEN